MAKASISAYSQTQTSNTVITDDSTDISIAEGWDPASVNNSFRTLMTHLADAYAGDAAYDSVTDTITAGTTQTQAGAVALTTTINRISVVGTSGDSVKLPTAVAGLQVLIINDDSAQTVKVWPNTSDTIDGGSANAVDSNQIAAGAARLYIATSATAWYTALNDLGATPLGVTSGGTGAASLTDGGILLGSGTGAVTATAVLADGEILVGDGTTDPVAESGATARTSLGLGTGDSPTFVTVTASTSVVPDAAGGADLGSTSAEWGDLYIADDKALKLGNDQNFTIEYDEDGLDTTRVVAAGGVTMSPHGTSSGNTTEMRFLELAANGNNYTGFKAPDSVTGTSVYQMPPAYPASSKYLQSTDAGVLTWESITAGASAADTVTKTSAYTIVAGDDNKTILASAASADYELALTASATLGDGWTCTIKKSDSSKYMITLNPSGSEVIDGLPDLKLRNEHASVTLICDGSNFHIRHHSNISYEYNAIDNSAFQIDQYEQSVTRTALGSGSTATMQDRWKIAMSGSPSARFTYSVESSGGVDSESRWMKMLCTTANASPDSNDQLMIRHNIPGNNLTGRGFLGTDGYAENMTLSFDVIVHLDGGSSESFPVKIAVNCFTGDSTAREYVNDVSVQANDTWERVTLVIPQDSAANWAASTGAKLYFNFNLTAGSGSVGTANTWANTSYTDYITSNSSNLADATNNYLGITCVKLQPGQIATPYVARTYEEELTVCKFYAELLSYQTAGSQVVAFGTASSTSAGQVSVTYAEKRAAPAVTGSAAGTFQLSDYNGGGTNDATGVSFNEPGLTNVRMSVSYGGTAFTTNDAIRVNRDSSDAAFIFINAEI
jgi:hypothetical protein